VDVLFKVKKNLNAFHRETVDITSERLESSFLVGIGKLQYSSVVT